MSLFSRTSVAFLLCSSLLVACTKETETRIEEKLPPAKIEASAQVNKNTITFAKASLGKTFIILPMIAQGGRSTEPMYLTSMLVSFELSGGRVAVYNHTIPNAENDVTSDVLLQTFPVISENADQVVFDIEKGFSNIYPQTAMDIVDPRTYPIDQDMMQRKLDKSIKVKDSFVKDLSLRNNSILIKQLVRMVIPYQNYVRYDDKEKEKLDKSQAIPKEVESGATLYFEIKPYVNNQEFKPKEYDSKERFGFFVNKVAVDESQNYSRGQIVRWDTSEAAGSIRVLLDKNWPESFRPGAAVAIQYWNRVFGKELLKLEYGYADQNPQDDRTIIIRWVQWDGGSGAYANTQLDPRTGEALRGYVQVTSVFTSDKNYKNANGVPSEGALASLKKGLCDLEMDPREMNKNNVISEVLAHEMGHVMGLRHNFAGSFNAQASDKELDEAMARAHAGDFSKPVALSSSVMDYFPLTASAILGEYIKNNVLSYDQMAINWAYKDVEVERAANMYCSDEHISAVAEIERTLLGCDRRDAYKNVFKAEIGKNIEDARNAISMGIRSLQFSMSTGSNFSDPNTLKSTAKYAVSFAPSVSIKDGLYKDAKTQVFMVPDDVVPSYLKSLSAWSYYKYEYYSEFNVGDIKITNDLKEVGGMQAFLKALDVNATNPGFFQREIANPQTAVRLADAGFSAEQVKVILEAWTERAAEMDAGSAAAAAQAVDVTKLRKSEWVN